MVMAAKPEELAEIIRSKSSANFRLGLVVYKPEIAKITNQPKAVRTRAGKNLFQERLKRMGRMAVTKFA